MPAESSDPGAREMATTRGMVSVAMATYNGAEFVTEQIASILPQLASGDEIVIVDDASTDDTVEVISRIDDPRIRLVRNEANRGYVHTFERALSLARGEVIFLSDQDDEWFPDRVRQMLAQMGERLLLVSNWEPRGGKPGFFERIRLRSRDSQHYLRNIVGILIGYRLHWGCAMVIRRELLDIALPFPQWMDESHDQYLAMAANMARSVRYMETNTVWHRLHDRNLTPQKPRALAKIARARVKLFGELAVLGSRLADRRGQTLMAPERDVHVSDLPASDGGVESGRRVAIVLSAFNPPDELPERVHDWTQWFGPVVVVDDGSLSPAPGIWDRLGEAGATVLHNPRNMGIAHALNKGIKRARDDFDPDWVLTMDQDSAMDRDYVHHAFDALDNDDEPGRVGMIAAATQNGVTLKTMAGPRGVTEVLDPMQSGTLIRADLFDGIGYLRDDYFIDSVDSEFNARARVNGYVLLAAPRCDLTHSLGAGRPMTILGWRAHIGAKEIRVIYHAPFRVYYITRNNIYTTVKYVWRQPVWVARRMYMELQSHLVRLTFGPNRRLLMVAMAHGFVDALRHRTGPIPDALAAQLRVDR
ncbi:glycosyltransferase [Propionibacterium freudenreichii]|uniref:glycosyltransferase n=1 Tax=Propionibacterium freudenreichii TaxID=1744 RepID=UPI000544044C|nr:glycosyltransferase [Propionibacterium freudenreichii]MDK9321812.1 glycosyltransferase [Propionibacterium freudenreichii]MDK9323383.1 glycosyltransferase [Propionibacterium freudenreichii]CEH07645.1 Rhamnosyltransferase, Glycosyl transferase family 2 [Propionibacterium freudenreichii]SCQ65762.1 Rhamnosyltransferase, Glycosyl transferase family 2 [Propionibacterium freudenreichii]SCQ75476.1 Rhamnosyltransferase, Glycosyl transferase family 2 [Propionibacterium freudenreichii]